MKKKKNPAELPAQNQQQDPQKQLQDLQETLKEKDEQLLRSIADLQNIRRRSEDDRLRLPQIGSEQIITALLPTLDTLELAIKNMPKKKDDWTKGVESVFTGLLGSLSAEGLQRIDKTGVPIDPEKHEVIAVDKKAKKGEVGEILQFGYEFRGKVIRAAKVKGGA